jgi:hypothetical protein
MPDHERIESVGKKVTRGVVFYDTQAVLDPREIVIAPLSISEAITIRERDSHERYWHSMNHPSCLHTQCANGVALRRFYQGHGSEDGSVFIETHLALMLWNLFLVVSLSIPLERIKNKKFRFMIDTESGEWVRNTDSTEG